MIDMIRKFLGMPNDSIAKTVAVTVGLCLICSLVVSTAAVALRGKQVENRVLDRQRNILAVAGLDNDSLSVEQRFERVEAKLVDLETGQYVEDQSPDDFDQREAARDPGRSVALSRGDDIAGIGRRANIAKVYLVRDEQGQISKVILPVHGYGLWSTLYGFISLEPDLNTVYRVKFYEHAETPGLGGEVDNPNWLKVWHGKQVYKDEKVELSVLKGKVQPGTANAEYHVDGLSGATLTSRGVSNLMHYWLGANGFKPYIENLKSGLSG